MTQQSGSDKTDQTIGDNVIEIFYIILFVIPTLFIAIKFKKQIKWLLTPFIWLKNVLDVQWWANFIGNKTGLFQRARNNRYRRWLETLPMKKKIAIELGVALPLMILMDHYILMPYLGMAMLPWNWDWSGG